jgi:periplasmic protein TonB
VIISKQILSISGAALMRIACGLFSLLLMAAVAAPKQENQKKEDKTESQAPVVSRIMVKGEVMKKKLVHKVTPVYPAQAMSQRVSGTVVLRVLIGVDGTVKNMQYVSGPRILVQATMDGVRQYKYQPTTLNGQPVEVDTTVETAFDIRS